jgi:MFS family permease
MAISSSRLTVVCLAIAGWGFGFGVGTQVVSLWAKQRGASDSLIGWLHAVYYLGVAVAAVAVPLLSRRWGLRTVLAGMALSAVTLALFPWSRGEIDWFVLRALSGAGCALSVIPLETLLSQSSPPEKRTQVFGWYGFAITLGGAIGMGLGPVIHPEVLSDDPTAMLIAAIGPALGFVLIAVSLDLSTRLIEDEANVALPIRTNVLPFGTAWGQGFLEGGLIAFLTLYLTKHVELSQDLAGVVLGTTVVGIVAFQVPASMLGDRYGPLRVLLVCYVVAIAGLLASPWILDVWALTAVLLVFGAFTGAMYPLGLSLLGRNTPPSGQPKAYAMYLGLECVGSVVGAAVTGHARDRWGEEALFHAGTIALVLVLLIWFATRVTTSGQDPAIADDGESAGAV